MWRLTWCEENGEKILGGWTGEEKADKNSRAWGNTGPETLQRLNRGWQVVVYLTEILI
jgi:hypothetical protein